MADDSDVSISSDQDPVRRYRRLVEQSGVGLFQTGTDGTVKWVNDAAAHIVGYDSAEEFMSSLSDIRDIYVDRSRRDDFERAIATQGSVSGFEYEIRRKDGAIRWISVSARPVRIAPDTIAGYEGTLTDITHDKLLRAALEAVSSRLDPQEAIARFAKVLGRVIPYQQVTLAVIHGSSYKRMVSISASGDTSAFPPHEQVPLAGNPMEAVIESRRPVVVDDTKVGRWDFDRILHERGVSSYAILPLLDDTGVFATFSIGAARRNAFDDEVVALLDSIAVVVANAVKNIVLFELEREAHERLEEADRLRRDLFAWVSHDLRSPLAVIKGSAQIVVKMWEQLSDEQKQDRMEVVVRQANRMESLLRRDLDLALIEAGELKCKAEPFDLADLAQTAVNDLAVADPSRAFELVIPDDLPFALGDRDRNLQVIGNLLSNAVKFSPEGSAIRIRVDGDDGFLRVDVHNEGPGIEVDRLDEIFDRMARLDQDREGTGLGLYISRYLVEAQGGRIWAASATDEGTSFSFTIPSADAAE